MPARRTSPLRAAAEFRGSRKGSHHVHPPGTSSSPGEPVRQTGIYEVAHDKQHREPHEVVMLAGDAFPPCDTCEGRVRFRLLRTAPYIFQDEDFEESGE
jgi:hypothetical protein